MLNQLIICGRFIESFKVDKDTYIKMMVPRSYKNEDGIYENDIISAKIYRTIIENIKHCYKGDIIGIRGKIETIKYNSGEDKLVIIAEKVTILSHRKKGDE